MAFQSVTPIARGYHFTVQVVADQPLFPAGCELRAEVRNFIGAAALAGTLSSGDGSITRIDDSVVQIDIAASITAELSNSSAAIDLVRMDTSPDVWLGIQFKLPVVKPVTAPGSDA